MEINLDDIFLMNSDDKSTCREFLLNKKEDKTRPLLVIYDYLWVIGGVERFVSAITKSLINKYNIILITIEKGEGFKLHPEVLHLNIGAGADYKKRLTELLLLLKPAVFICTTNVENQFADIYATLRKSNIKTICSNRANFFHPFAEKYFYSEFVNREASFKAANVVTWLTNFSLQAYSLSDDNGVLMPNSVSSAHDCTNGSKKNKTKTVLFVGRIFDPNKRVDRAIKAFAQVLKVHPDAKLLLVGKYDLNIKVDKKSSLTVSELIERLQIPEPNIQFVGEKANVNEFYKQADVFVLTSEFEGFPQVLLESSIYCLPSVIFDIPGLEDIIEDGINGYIVQQDDIDAMADKISYLLEHDDVRKRMSQKACELVSRFSESIIAKRWENLIEMLIKNDDQKMINNNLRIYFSSPIRNNDDFYKRYISLTNQYLSKLTDEIVISQNELSHTQALLADTQAQLTHTQAQLTHTQAQLKNIIISKSWKLTKPLRFIKRALKK